MKMHHTPIEATNPFAEAANGGQPMPGQGGVTGGGEAHEAWHRAVEQANLDLEDGVNTDGVAVQVDGPTVVPVVGMGDQERTDEVSVSWDRLSMTVASMVAWNMQVEMVEESPAGEIALGTDPSQIASIDPNSVLLNDDGADTMTQESELGSGLALALSKAITDTNAEFPNESVTEVAVDSDMTENLATASSLQSPVDSVVELETLGSAESGKDVQLTSSVVSTNANTEVTQQQNTSILSAASSDEGVIGQQLEVDPTTGMETSFTPGADESGSVQTGQTVAQSTNVMASANTETTPENVAMEKDVLTPELKTTTDASKAVKTTTKPVDTGLERLAGIRAAVAELDAHVAKSSQTTSTHDPSAELKGRLAELEMTYRVARDVIHNTNTSSEKSVTTQPIGNGELKTSKLNQPSGDETTKLDGDDLDSPVTRRAPGSSRNLAKPEMASGIHRPGRMSQTGGTNSDVNSQMSFSEASASITGNENSEISADVDRTIEYAEFDAANIEAGEVPELPVGDLSQLDIDIDDPAGNVRLAMSKEAEEVVVRLQTPEEVVEEYREMEEEIGKQIAKQGLDLTDFTADAHGDESEDGESSLLATNESNQTAPTDVLKGEQTLEETGDSARLVNRIV